MELSKLQKLREDLQRLDLTNIDNAVLALAGQYQQIELVNYSKDPMNHFYDQMASGARGMRSTIKNLVADIDRDCDAMYESYLARSEAEDPIHDRATVEDNRELRQMRILPDTEQVIKSRLGNYMNWRWAGLEIGPGDGYWTQHLVSLDPLYVADVHQEFLDATKRSFSPEYQLRIRPYLIKDCDFSALPKKQIGMVFAWNVFNYMSMSHIERYLTAIKPVLKPGAILFFSYNNGDRYAASRLCERGFATFVPNSRLVPMLQGLGFEILRSMDMETSISWMEIKAPGGLASNRSGQTLGKIVQTNT